MTVTTENSGAQALAALLQRAQPADRFAARRQFAYDQMKAGASTAPVQSWGEGLARALQAGVGGYFAGQADRDEDARDRAGLDTMAALLGAKTDAERMGIIQGSQGEPRLFVPLYQHMLAKKIAEEQAEAKRKQELSDFRRINNLPPIAAPGASGPPVEQVPGELGASGAPAGFDNNPGNIRATNINWTGKGAPHRGFETFATPQDGANAMATNMRSYLERNPDMTVAQMIARWAPPSENNTDAYIRTVAESTGVNPAMPLSEVLRDPLLGATVMKAMTQVEKGRIPAGFNDDTFVGAVRRGVPGGAPPVATAPPVQLAQAGGPPAAMPGPVIPPPPAVPTPGVPPPVAARGSGQPMPAADAASAPPPVFKPPQKRPLSPEIYERIYQMFDAKLITAADAARLVKTEEAAQLAQDYKDAETQFKAEVEQFTYQRGRRDKEADFDRQQQAQIDAERRKQEADAARAEATLRQPTQADLSKLANARMEADNLVLVAETFRTAWQNSTRQERREAQAGITNNLTTAYNLLLGMAKGEALLNLGVLAGPDMELMRKIVPDPSTFRAMLVRGGSVDSAVDQVVKIANRRIGLMEKELDRWGQRPPSPEGGQPGAAAVPADGATTRPTRIGLDGRPL